MEKLIGMSLDELALSFSDLDEKQRVKIIAVLSQVLGHDAEMLSNHIELATPQDRDMMVASHGDLVKAGAMLDNAVVLLFRRANRNGELVAT